MRLVLAASTSVQQEIPAKKGGSGKGEETRGLELNQI